MTAFAYESRLPLRVASGYLSFAASYKDGTLPRPVDTEKA
jgi:hypothetical protein